MIHGIGIDLVEVARVQENLLRHGERFTRRLFTADERRYCSGCDSPAPHYAARFAAKEGLMKALGTGHSRGISWQDVNVRNSPGGRPEIQLGGKAKEIASEFGITRVSLSLTHTNCHAAAVVVLEREENR